jgi:hypothetical protein
LVVTLLVVVLDESSNGLLQLPGKVVVFQTNDVVEGTMVALNLALGHGMKGFASCVGQPVRLQILREVVGDIGRTVVGQQTRTVFYRDLGEVGGSESAVEGVLHIGMRHARRQLPRQNVA